MACTLRNNPESTYDLTGYDINNNIMNDRFGILNLTSTGLTELLPEIGDLTWLSALLLGENLLTALPPEIGNLINLGFLNLYDNQLTGIIPEEICNQGDSTPSVGQNQLCTPYPDCISQDDIDSQDTSNCP